jgi:Transmembrane secretion effector
VPPAGFHGLFAPGQGHRFEPGPADGPVLVTIGYEVAPDDTAAFLAAFPALERSRRRTGSDRDVRSAVHHLFPAGAGKAGG